MSKLQDFLDDETGYQFAILDIKNAIDNYGLSVVLEAISSYRNDNHDLDLTNLRILDTMMVQ
jgi:hypothetical protein